MNSSINSCVQLQSPNHTQHESSPDLFDDSDTTENDVTKKSQMLKTAEDVSNVNVTQSSEEIFESPYSSQPTCNENEDNNNESINDNSITSIIEKNDINNYIEETNTKISSEIFSSVESIFSSDDIFSSSISEKTECSKIDKISIKLNNSAVNVNENSFEPEILLGNLPTENVNLLLELNRNDNKQKHNSSSSTNSSTDNLPPIHLVIKYLYIKTVF